jgi:hypothetical protein
MVQLLIFALVLVLVVFPLWAIIRIIALGRDNESLGRRLQDIDLELARLRQREFADHTRETAERAYNTQPTAPIPTPAEFVTTPTPEPVVPPTASEAFDTEPIQSTPLAAPEPTLQAAAASDVSAVPPPPHAPTPAPFSPPPMAPIPPPLERPYEEPQPSFFERINWEQFTGAKLFAWIGGLAAFLAAAFFVKYSFEHDLIPPEVRVAIGFLFAIGLVIGGLKVPRERYAPTAQTLIATGIVSLYAVTFACSSIYHFAFFGPIATFGVMTLITATAFLLAVRLDARVIAVLGILGGFLTPVLLSTGHDNPAGLFGYLALLDVGLIAVALHRRWHFLVPLGATGTVLMQIGWAGNFFADEKAGIAVIVCIGFSALFLGATALARRRGASSPLLMWSAALMACVCFGFALYFNTSSGLRARPGLLFSFVLITDLCLFGLAWIERRPTFVALAAGGAVLVELVWIASSLSPQRATTAMGVCLGFCAVFLAAYFLARRFRGAAEAEVSDRSVESGTRPTNNAVALEIVWSAVAMPFVAFAVAFVFLTVPLVAARPGLLFTFVMLADLALLALAWCDERLPKLHLAGGIAVFALLAAWNSTALVAGLLPWALAFTLAYAALHTAFPLVLERYRPNAAPAAWSQLIPPIALALMLVPLFRLDEVSLVFWPCVLLVDALAIVVALATASLAAVAAVLLLTLAATGIWIFHVPVIVALQPEALWVIGGFGVLFFAATVFLGRRLGATAEKAAGIAALFGDTRSQLPAFSALLPFLLLIMMTQRLPMANPSPVFGLALLLTVLTLGLAFVMTLPWLPACALAGVAGLEYAWQARHLASATPTVALTWYLVFLAVFAAYPFAFQRRFAGVTGPWAAAALASIAQFGLVYQLIRTTSPNHFLGALPATFALLPLLSLVGVLRGPTVNDRARLNQLAWFGGTALLFITLIFPTQFDRQWLTLGWALEGAALLWLFLRVPHPGLRAVGVVLLVTAFVRLALNPAVLEYHARGATPLLNWYLYSYGLVTLALFLGARLAAPPRHQVFGCNVPPLLNTLGTVLAFLLLNIEIADFFSVPGVPVLTFQFSGNFARDMSYTIAWSLFALALLLVSIWRRVRAGRYAALGLLGVAVAKLFFHDLSRLDSLYRIGALFAVAVVAIVASFAYQRFLPNDDQPPSSGS